MMSKSANWYAMEDYPRIIANLFQTFGLDFNSVEMVKGLSTDLEIVSQFSSREFDLVYIDGDHSFDAVICDLEKYSKLVRAGGFLVMDDASCFLPGTKFWKGHVSVSKACDGIEVRGFENVLNMGHNRVYRMGNR